MPLGPISLLPTYLTSIYPLPTLSQLYLPSGVLTARWSVQLIYGMAVMHRAGMVHRDLKPANIMIDENSDIKIAGNPSLAYE